MELLTRGTYPIFDKYLLINLICRHVTAQRTYRVQVIYQLFKDLLKNEGYVDLQHNNFFLLPFTRPSRWSTRKLLLLWPSRT